MGVKVWFWPKMFVGVALAVAVGWSSDAALSAPVRTGAPSLSDPVRTGVDEFRFTLNGESNRTLIVEASADLRTWTNVASARLDSTSAVVMITAPSPASFFRAVPAPLGCLIHAIGARGSVDLNGRNLRTDSFDSADPIKSTLGAYDPLKAGDSGDVLAFSGLTNSLEVGNARIYGRLLTGPGMPVVIGPQGSVGSVEWHSNPQSAGSIEPGWVRDDATASFPEVRRPFVGGLTAGGAVFEGAFYKYALYDANDYTMQDLTLSAGEKMVVLGHCRLRVLNVSVTGDSAGIIVRTNASLQMYVYGSAATIGGDGVMNETGNALGFQYYGMRTNETLNLVSNGTFAGTVYAPSADCTIYGSTGSTKIIGAVLVRALGLGSHLEVHYDENIPRR